MKLNLLFLILSLACYPYRSKFEAYKKKVKILYPDSSHYLEANGRQMHYVKTGKGSQLIVFVHGSPGSWDAFAEYLANEELATNARLVSVDRFGFGLSEPEKPEPSLFEQCEFISKIVKLETQLSNVKSAILVGHSFGGPVVACVAAKNPSIVSQIIFLAASLDPELEKISWYQDVGNWYLIRAILPRALDHSNQEILPLKRELEELKSELVKIRADIIALHGNDDSLVPYGNVKFIETNFFHLKPAIFTLENEGHFFIWGRADFVIKILRELTEKKTQHRVQNAKLSAKLSQNFWSHK